MKQNYIIGKSKGNLCKKNGIILTNAVKKSGFSFVIFLPRYHCVLSQMHFKLSYITLLNVCFYWHLC